MKTYGYIVVSAFAVVTVSAIKLSQHYDTLWLIVLVLATLVGGLTLTLGMYSAEAGDYQPKAQINSPEDRLIISQAEYEYLASTNMPKKTPEWESQG